MNKRLLITLLVLMMPLFVLAQISGKVTDNATGESLPGASVYLDGTNIGTATDVNGNYTINNVPSGSYTIIASFVGYRSIERDITIGNTAMTVNFALQEALLETTGLDVVADRARERVTPVAFTDISKEKIVNELGSRDIPLVLNTTPSVYATEDGGGAGDARINVRGFNQRNIAIMINGVPVNDMENGWVYWSNWDGLGDAASNIQVQRGLSAINLATPSIGGVMNIVTDPTANSFGGSVKQEFGSGSFLKSTLSLNSGLINGKFAISGNIVRKTGDGIIDGTYTDAWAYYLGAALNVNSNNRLEWYAVGAPQKHGQRLYAQNIATFNTDYALSLEGYDPAALQSNGGSYNDAGYAFNQNAAPVSSSYTGMQSNGGTPFDRYSPDMLWERENFFHKPQVNMNWYSTFNENFSLFTTVYYSGGEGGGTGTYGSSPIRVPFDRGGGSPFASLPYSIDWDATIDRNETNSSGSRTILRNSRNNQWTVGAISKAKIKASDNLSFNVGIDWRTASIDHYREVRDLLGGTYYNCTGSCASDFWSASESQRGLGDKINYDFTNQVDWIGTFAQGEYTNGQLAIVGMAGYSTIKYTHENFFLDDGTGNPLMVESPTIGGFQVKGGVNYNVSPMTSVYANAGYVEKVPIFDNVISDFDGTLAADPANEKFNSYEAGVNFRLMDGKMTTKFSYYYTDWRDRAFTRFVQQADGNDGILFLSGVNTLHTGFEVEAAYQASRMFRLDFAGSVGNWKHTDDVNGTYKDYATNTDVMYNLYLKDLKVGDAPQTQLAVSATLFPITGLRLQATARYNADHYADWDPLSRGDATDRTQSWQAPDYTVLDANFSYNLPVKLGGARIQLFGFLFNVLNEVYIQDATDNSSFNGFDQDHDADDAEVFLGLPRRFNGGLRIRF